MTPRRRLEPLECVLHATLLAIEDESAVRVSTREGTFVFEAVAVERAPDVVVGTAVTLLVKPNGVLQIRPAIGGDGR